MRLQRARLNMKESGGLPFNIRFFSEGESVEGTGNGGEPKDEWEQPVEGKRSGSDSFSKADVDRMMKESREAGRKSALKAFGFGSEEEAKQASGLLKALLDSRKTEEQKRQEAAEESVRKIGEYEKRAVAAENRLTCVLSGVKADAVDDVMALAAPKITETNTLESVLKDMRKSERYASFFGGTSEGTGTQPGHSRGQKDMDLVGFYEKHLSELKNESGKTGRPSFFD